MCFVCSFVKVFFEVFGLLSKVVCLKMKGGIRLENYSLFFNFIYDRDICYENLICKLGYWCFFLCS